MLKTRLALVLALSCFLPGQGLANVDVDLVAVTAGAARQDTVLTDYFLTFSVLGTDIVGGRVLKPGAPPAEICVLTDQGAGEEWGCDLFDFVSLDEICQLVGFGDFLFELDAGSGPDDTLTVFFDPGCTDPIAGHPVITAPTSGGIVPPVPAPDDFCWTCSAPGACGPGDTAVSLFDNGDSDLAVDVLRGIALPACWDPGICIPTGPNDEFEVSALDIDADFEPRTTSLGDEFEYVSAFESVNLTTYDVNDAAPTSPPAVPDGDGVSSALLARKTLDDGSQIALTWDVDSCCAVASHHLVFGSSDDLPSAPGLPFGLDGAQCGLGSSGTFDWIGVPAAPGGDMVWWLVLANDGAALEGSWGHGESGLERAGPGAGGASNQCGFSTRDTTNACGR